MTYTASIQLERFVLDNWRVFTDAEIAKKRGVSVSTVARMRKRLGLLRGPSR